MALLLPPAAGSSVRSGVPPGVLKKSRALEATEAKADLKGEVGSPFFFSVY